MTTRTIRKIANLIFLSLLIAACGGAMPASAPPAETFVAPPPPEVWPTNDWQEGDAEQHGFPDSMPAAVQAHVESELPFLDGLAIIRDGVIVFELYQNGFTPESLHDTASVSKSWTSALVGMALADGSLHSLDTTLPELLPDESELILATGKGEITLRHLLEMRSGIDFSQDALNWGEYGGEELLKGDVVEFALNFPMAYEPGAAWIYSTLDTLLISAVMEEATGQPLAEYAESSLFSTLGVEEFAWLADSTGTTLGGQNLSMSLRDMAKLGLLYLHGGKWEEEQVVPAEWVQTSITPQNRSAYHPPSEQDEIIEWYGYHWYTWKEVWHHGCRSFQASGYGGQQVLVLPDLNIIIATLNQIEGVDPDTADLQHSKTYELIRDVIFAPLPGAEADSDLC